MSLKKTLHLGSVALGLMLFLQSARANVSVTVSPSTITSLVGSNATFTAQATPTAGETITGYTWKGSPNGQPPYTVVSGATGPTLAFNNVQTGSAGSYFVSVTYNSGTNTGLTAVSTAATLVVNDQARIIVQPVGGLIRVTGSAAAFSVGALGAQPLTYQWRLNGTPFGDSSRISGSSSSLVVITNLTPADTGNYDVVVSNAYATAISQPAALTVLDPPSILVPPAPEILIAGSNAVLTVVAAGGSPLSYQWVKGTNNLSNVGRVSGATSNTLTIISTATNDSANYSVVISNPVGSITSAPVSVLVLLPPVFTSATNALGQQGFPFHYTAIATGSLPITFGADGLPDGLMITPGNGVISGTPTVSGVFNVTLYATNAAVTASTNLQITLVTDVPGITSPLTNSAMQGSNFVYTITASNNPTVFTAVGLPDGMSFSASNGIISGPPLPIGTFPITLTAGNQYGTDTETLTLTVVSGAPIITSALTVRGTENRTNFTYTITATNSPVTFGAIGLPQGLILNPTNGLITGTPTYGGTNNVTITAANAYGVGSNTLVVSIAYATVASLAVTNVTPTYSSPYLLDFTFALRDGTNAVVRPPEQLTVQVDEGNIANTNDQYAVPLGDESATIISRAISTKLFKTFFVMDYTYSMFATPNAIDDMQTSVENLINQEPSSAQFGVVEFSADYLPPIQVTGFTADKVLLSQEINGIQTNYVQGNYAGTRFYDALATALTNFPGTNAAEERYVVLLSDGYDDSSVLATTTNMPTQADVIVGLASNANVKIYCVGFGPNPNTDVLQQLTSQTGGNYYPAATPAAIINQFALLLKDINSLYILRWATLQRSSSVFQPMFTVNLGALSAPFNTNIMLTNVPTMTNSGPPVVTNFALTNFSLVPLYSPAMYAGNVQQGALELVPDSTTNASSVTLHASYVPRYIRQIHLQYRANYSVTPVLLATNIGDILNGWTLTQTNDLTNGQWITLTSPNPSNLLSSLPYGIESDLISFQFPPQGLANPSNAFSLFVIDNSIYSNTPPVGQSFVLTNSTQYITNLPPTPPFGTPVPWLIANGFTNLTNFAAVELTDPNNNGLTVWQDYIAGLNPNDTNSTFGIQTFLPPQPGLPPVITFNSVLGRTYRVDAATTLNTWLPLQDNIAGTGFPISVSDNRNLSGVNGVFYRLVVYHP